MANFIDNPHFSHHDDYYTKKESWFQLQKIKHKIAPTKILEACCMGANLSKSAEYLTELFECPVVENKENFLDLDNDTIRENYSHIITNPPFQNPGKQNIITKLLEIDLPFIIILNSTNIYAKWFRQTFGDKIRDTQILNPLQKLCFHKAFKNDNDEWELQKKTHAPPFYPVFVSYKLGLDSADLFL
jgi:hypothetical protein